MPHKVFLLLDLSFLYRFLPVPAVAIEGFLFFSPCAAKMYLCLTMGRINADVPGRLALHTSHCHKVYEYTAWCHEPLAANTTARIALAAHQPRVRQTLPDCGFVCSEISWTFLDT